MRTKRILFVAAALVTLALPVTGCLGRVRVRPGVVAERTHEGPDGNTKDSAYYGGQILEWEGEDPAGNKGLGSGFAYLGMMMFKGLLVVAGVIGLGFAIRWVFGRKS